MAATFDIYLAIIRIAWLNILAYRTYAVMQVIGMPIVLFSYYFLYSSLFAYSRQGMEGTVAGFDMRQLMTYATLVSAIRMFQRTNIDRHIGHRVRSGMIAIDFIRPLNFMIYCFFRGFGRTLFRTSMIVIPTLVLGVLFGFLHPPAGGVTLMLFPVSLILAYMIGFFLSYIVGLVSFFVQYNMGIAWGVELVISIAAGVMVPLDFYPDAMRAVLQALPFDDMIYMPTMLYLGRITGAEALGVIGAQAVWLVVFWLAALALGRGAANKLMVQGG